MNMCMRVWTRVCEYMYARIYVCMYLSLCVCIYVCMYVCMHACMHVCVHARVSVVRVGGWVGGVAERQRERVSACGWVSMCVCAEVRVAVCVVARHTHVYQQPAVQKCWSNHWVANKRHLKCEILVGKEHFWRLPKDNLPFRESAIVITTLNIHIMLLLHMFACVWVFARANRVSVVYHHNCGKSTARTASRRVASQR